MQTILTNSAFLKCPKCGKLHLYEYFEDDRNAYKINVKCHSCGELLNDTNIELQGSEDMKLNSPIH